MRIIILSLIEIIVILFLFFIGMMVPENKNYNLTILFSLGMLAMGIVHIIRNAFNGRRRNIRFDYGGISVCNYW